jgi:hypothetical protein
MNPYQQSRQQGYTDKDIVEFLATNPKYSEKIKKSREAGHSDEDIGQFLSNYDFNQKPERSGLEQAGRLAGQFALGAAEIGALPYEVAVAPLGIKGGQEAMGDLFTRDVLNDVYPTEEEGRAPRDTIFSQPNRELKEPIDLSIKGLTEKVTGLDLHPEGFLEKAAHWTGMLRNPKKIIEAGLKPKELIKAIAPTAPELLRGAGAGAALQAAEEGEFGPIGTLAAAVAGDLLGHGASQIGKIGKELITKPKETLAKAAAKFTASEAKELQREIIKDFRNSGIQADLGTITDSNLVKWTQSRIAQSGLTGKAAQELKDLTTTQIKDKYKQIADTLGEAKFSSQHEAGEVVKDAITRLREADLNETRNLYKNAEQSLPRQAYVNTSKINGVIDKLEKSLKPGQVKSTEQNVVLGVLEKLKRDVRDSAGGSMSGNVKDLMNNKLGIQDVINYEVQGGAKQLLKEVVKEIDKAIISHGKDNPTFAKNYINANKRFANHAKTYRNREVQNMLNSLDPATIMNKMNSVQGIRSIEKALKASPEGKEIINNLKRKKLDDVIANKLVDSTTQQVKLGTFSKLLEKGKNREIIKEILGEKAFQRLEKLQKNAGRLADAADKFYNASKSGTTIADATVVMQVMKDLGHLLYGNPWPFIRTVGGVQALKKISSLIANPQFLKLTEEAILASEKGTQEQLIFSFERLAPYLEQINHQVRDENGSPSLDDNPLQIQ